MAELNTFHTTAASARNSSTTASSSGTVASVGLVWANRNVSRLIVSAGRAGGVSGAVRSPLKVEGSPVSHPPLSRPASCALWGLPIQPCLPSPLSSSAWRSRSSRLACQTVGEKRVAQTVRASALSTDNHSRTRSSAAHLLPNPVNRARKRHAQPCLLWRATDVPCRGQVV